MTDRLHQIVNRINRLPNDDQTKLLEMIEPLVKIRESLTLDLNDDYDQFFRMNEMGAHAKEILGTHARAIIVNSDNGIMAVDPEDCVVGLSLRYEGSYGVKEIASISGMVTSETKILVVGAHIGSLVIPLAKQVKSVTAIEANPDTFELLKLNIELNHVNNCELINIAASDTTGEISFLLSRVNSGGSKRKPLTADFMYTYDNPKEIRVKSAALDEILNDQTFDIILMDLEGSEYFALKGMTKLLNSARMLIIEFIPHHLKNVAGIGVETFLSLLTEFKFMTMPSIDMKVPQEDFSKMLNLMVDHDASDDGLIFEK